LLVIADMGEDIIEPKFCKTMYREWPGNDPYIIAPDLTFKVDGRDGFVLFTENPLAALFCGAALWLCT